MKIRQKLNKNWTKIEKLDKNWKIEKSTKLKIGQKLDQKLENSTKFTNGEGRRIALKKQSIKVLIFKKR